MSLYIYLFNLPHFESKTTNLSRRRRRVAADTRDRIRFSSAIRVYIYYFFFPHRTVQSVCDARTLYRMHVGKISEIVSNTDACKTDVRVYTYSCR